MKKRFRKTKFDRLDANHYKWGFLYYDLADYRIIVPKKIAWMGWTLNFASPFSYLIIAGIIAFAWWINKLLGQ